MNDNVLAVEAQTVPDKPVVDTTMLVEGDDVLIIGPLDNAFRGKRGKVIKVAAITLSAPGDQRIVVGIEGPHVTTVQCCRSNLLTVFG